MSDKVRSKDSFIEANELKRADRTVYEWLKTMFSETATESAQNKYYRQRIVSADYSALFDETFSFKNFLRRC